MSQLELIVEVDEEQLTLLIEDAVQHLEDISAEAGNILQREVDGLYVPNTSTDKVDKEVGKSLISDAELIRLATVATDATKNRADILNADKVHTHVISDVTGLSTRLSDIGELSQLTTTAKSNLVDAINEAAASGGSGGSGGVVIDDAAGLGDTHVTWSADKSSRELEDKVDKVAGMGLSELSFTTADKNSLDQSEQDRHTHDNKSIIDDLSDNAGALEYRGLPVSDQAALDAKVDKVAGYSLVDDDEIAKLLTVEQDAQKNTVNSVAGRQGDVLLDKSDVGLGAVDNTSDADKPVSTTVAAALGAKVDKQAGKGLSDTNFTQSEKDKLSSLESSKFIGLFVSESALPLSGSEGDYANVDGGLGSDVYRVIWDSSDNKWVRVQGVSTELTDTQIKQQYESNPDTNAFTDDEKAKLSSVANGATANRADILNADKVHTHVISDVTGLSTRLNDIDALIGDVESVLVAINGEP